MRTHYCTAGGTSYCVATQIAASMKNAYVVIDFTDGAYPYKVYSTVRNYERMGA